MHRELLKIDIVKLTIILFGKMNVTNYMYELFLGIVLLFILIYIYLLLQALAVMHHTTLSLEWVTLTIIRCP